MKRLIPYIALLALIVVVGCSADSPRANPAPTVVPENWSVVSLTASNTGPFVGTVILVEATVELNGSPVPDDTVIIFESTSGGVFASGTAEASVLSEGGTASVAYLAETAGTYVVRARVQGASREITIEYVDRATTDSLQVTNVNPRRGSYAGGDQVVVTAKGVESPVEVFFDLDGFAYQAIIVGVTESVPLSADGTITVITPAFTGTNTGIQQTADVRVNTNAGTGSQQTDTLPDAFVLLPGGGPQIFGLTPSSGRSSGGEVVNVLGQGFGSVASDLSVSFADTTGVVKLGTVLAVSPDGTQIQVETPRFSTLPLTVDEPQDVTVATVDGVVSLEDAFIVLADEPIPTIASISPIAGPLDGGTLVTIFGSGFQVPVQVTFGGLTALDVNVFNDTTPADNDRITCVTPDYSQQGAVPPVGAAVVVTNVTSGSSDTYESFTYGDALYITGNSPSEGGLGDLVIIYGSGFEDPLQVFLGDVQMEVISVSGTELVVKIPDDQGVECAERSNAFRVVLLESGLEAEGGDFTIRGNTPLVLSTDPVFVEEFDDVTITGMYFAPNLFVEFNGSQIDPDTVDRQSDTSIFVNSIPSADSLGISFATTACTAPGNVPGSRLADTAVSVGVINLPGNCADVLPGALVYSPPPPNDCVPTPAELDTSPIAPGDTWQFPDATNPACSATLLLTLENIQGADATGIVFTPPAGEFFNVPGSTTCTGTLSYLQTCVYAMEFCPSGPGLFTDQLTIDYFDSVSPQSITINLSGTGL